MVEVDDDLNEHKMEEEEFNEHIPEVEEPRTLEHGHDVEKLENIIEEIKLNDGGSNVKFDFDLDLKCGLILFTQMFLILKPGKY